MATVVFIGPASADPPPQPTESELTAQWWKWAYSLPVSENPLFDETGAKAGNGQPYQGSKVFFLAGVFNASGTAERSITVPAGTAFFFPLINIEWDNLPALHPGDLTVAELYAVVASFIDATTELHVTLNGVSLLDNVDRVQSPPFAYHLPKKDSLLQLFYGLDIPEVSPAVSDGYWLYIPPLASGTYTLNFGGTVFGDTLIGPQDFTVDITYHITVE
jgi:hypothetical protein